MEKFVSNTKENIFVLQNLPEVIKGALFSRYSRSRLGFRELLEKDFLENAEASITNVQKAVDFYDRILDGYGDDSVAELGGAHIALEEVSMLAAKVIEDARIGGSPLEKSTRYVPFSDQLNGKWRYCRDADIMASEFKDEYIQTMDGLFETYVQLIAPMTERMEALYPLPEGASEAAWRTSVKALVFDCLRGLLPASTLTNMGLFGNGRFFEGLLMKMRLNPLAEMKEIAEKGFQELSKVIPSFVKRAEKEHRHFKSYAEYMEALGKTIQGFNQPEKLEPAVGFQVHLVKKPDASALDEMIAILLYEKTGADLSSLTQFVTQISQEEKTEMLKDLGAVRKNRRHKSPRALEHMSFTFEITADFGCYRDLQRHRILTQERQRLTCHHGYVIPQEIEGTDLEAVYVKALEQAKQFFLKIEKVMPLQAQYAVPMAYNIRWYVHLNLRALQWLAELRSTPQGHPEYRKVAQQMAASVIEAFPPVASLLEFVDYSEHAIGRLAQEERTLKKKGV